LLCDPPHLRECRWTITDEVEREGGNDDIETGTAIWQRLCMTELEFRGPDANATARGLDLRLSWINPGDGRRSLVFEDEARESAAAAADVQPTHSG
jgi:hypothetical protein